MKVCYFGTYSPNYTRNRVNITGLRENGVEVIECNIQTGGLRKHWDLFRKHWPMRGSYDVMIVGFNGHAIMPVAWLVTRFPRKKLVFDAFISAYDTNIFDRKKHLPHSLMALKYWIIDWLACSLADLVLMDAEAYAKYVSETFHISRQKVKGLFVGCPNDVMYPRPQNKAHSAKAEPDFIVHFHGTYIPAQGIPYIIEAARILDGQGVKFNLIGKLDTYGEAINLVKRLKLTNVRFYDYMPYNKLAEFMANADICLGGFGDTEKAKMAGIFKIIEAMAMKKPFITADTPAMREFLTDRKDSLLCKSADGQDLADKILELKNNVNLRNTIAENGYQLYLRRFTPKAIGRDLMAFVNSIK
ncbi:MAG: glycosyltransferase [Patescibacteria group bacterium]